MDRVTAREASDVGWSALSDELVATLRRHRFPRADGPTVVINSFLFGEAVSGALP